VHQGDLLMQIDPRPSQAQLEQAEANKAKDQANLENAQRDLARYAAIVSNQMAVTRQQYDTQRATVEQDQATVQSDQAQSDAAKLNVAYCEITSPIDGVTGLRLVDIGNLVQASAATPLVVVTQIKPVYVKFTVPERDLDRIQQAMTQHPLSVLAFNGDDDNQPSRGTFKLVNNQVDQSTGTVTLKAESPTRMPHCGPASSSTPTSCSVPSRTGSPSRRGRCRWVPRDRLCTSSRTIRQSKRN
jgi:multidrug efflux system membrane fusion protein